MNQVGICWSCFNEQNSLKHNLMCKSKVKVASVRNESELEKRHRLAMNGSFYAPAGRFVDKNPLIPRTEMREGPLLLAPENPIPVSWMLIQFEADEVSENVPVLWELCTPEVCAPPVYAPLSADALEASLEIPLSVPTTRADVRRDYFRSHAAFYLQKALTAVFEPFSVDECWITSVKKRAYWYKHDIGGAPFFFPLWFPSN